MPVVLTDQDESTVASPDGLHVSPIDAEHITGWSLKPEGMCRDDVCVPLPSGMMRDGRVDVAAFWSHIGNPVLHDDAAETWVLGAGAGARNAALAGLDAPDFALPDLSGVTHRLSELRGRKVFLTTWASW